MLYQKTGYSIDVLYILICDYNVADVWRCTVVSRRRKNVSVLSAWTLSTVYWCHLQILRWTVWIICVSIDG